ncbi:hypothetical protein HYV49_00425 [Candidatus Pacearchaeota archaeon]|nr:hypothetical protein [Candidatus Pacearchaeota archaeon]
MKLKKVMATKIQDSRKEDTIQVMIKTEKDEFVASAPSGKSKGRFEAPYYVRSIGHDINVINKYFKNKRQLRIDEFKGLNIIEQSFEKKIGANSMIALESAILKAVASDNGKEVWEFLNPKARKLPYLVGNCIGGGLHSVPHIPVFQEFLCIPIASVAESININKKVHEHAAEILRKKDHKFTHKTNDENAWQTFLNHDQVLELMLELKRFVIDNFTIRFNIGIDIAASSFFGKTYKYEKFRLKREEQIEYISSLLNKKGIFYAEDPVQENDFSGFSKILNNLHNKNHLIVGDDLTVTNIDRLNEAIKLKSINAIIIKPNQSGSLIAVKNVVDFARRKGIKTVFSHRSGETHDNILADLAVAWRADFFKAGIFGKEREAKLNRLKEIETLINKKT